VYTPHYNDHSTSGFDTYARPFQIASQTVLGSYAIALAEVINRAIDEQPTEQHRVAKQFLEEKAGRIGKIHLMQLFMFRYTPALFALFALLCALLPDCVRCLLST
jgi:hypothetical protein